MATQIQITQYDPATKRYIAQLTVTKQVPQMVEDEVTHEAHEELTEVVLGTYTCEGTWHDEDAVMVAGALYDQHKAALAKQATVEAEKQAIADKIAVEVGKLATLPAEVK